MPTSRKAPNWEVCGKKQQRSPSPLIARKPRPAPASSATTTPSYPGPWAHAGHVSLRSVRERERRLWSGIWTEYTIELEGD